MAHSRRRRGRHRRRARRSRSRPGRTRVPGPACPPESSACDRARSARATPLGQISTQYGSCFSVVARALAKNRSWPAWAGERIVKSLPAVRQGDQPVPGGDVPLDRAPEVGDFTRHVGGVATDLADRERRVLRVHRSSLRTAPRGPYSRALSRRKFARRRPGRASPGRAGRPVAPRGGTAGAGYPDRPRRG